MFDLRILLVAISISITQWACGKNRISGTYITQGNDFAEMLQLTQTDNSHVDGVMTTVAISGEQQMTSRHCQVSGAVDAGQITLACHYGLLEDTNLAGTVNWTKSAIQFQWAAPDGKFVSAMFARSSPREFKTYTENLKLKADGMALTKEILKRAQQLRQTMQYTENWISNAESHTQKIPGIEDYLKKLENQMSLLVEREKRTWDSFARGEIVFAVNQGEFNGSQADGQIDQVWDRTIGENGQNLKDAFANFPSTCGPLDRFSSRKLANGLSASVGSAR